MRGHGPSAVGILVLLFLLLPLIGCDLSDWVPATLTGTITDARTHVGIARARVTIGEHVKYSAGSGVYTVTGLKAHRSYAIQVKADGYQPWSREIMVHGITSECNVALTPEGRSGRPTD